MAKICRVRVVMDGNPNNTRITEVDTGKSMNTFEVEICQKFGEPATIKMKAWGPAVDIVGNADVYAGAASGQLWRKSNNNAML